jgi:protein SCO1/2
MKNWIGMLLVGILGCSSQVEKLPIYGNYELNEVTTNGVASYDTIYHKIDEFAFVDQDSTIVTNATFDSQIYVADFFFTSCPSICPIMKTQMLRVYEQFNNEPSVAFLSHTIDPQYDTVALLKDYSDRLGVRSEKWHFVTGDQQEIFKIAQLSYMSVAADDEEAPGGYIHSGRFLLVDKERRIRGAYDGTNPEEVDKLMTDMNILLQSYEQK